MRDWSVTVQAVGAATTTDALRAGLEHAGALGATVSIGAGSVSATFDVEARSATEAGAVAAQIFDRAGGGADVVRLEATTADQGAGTPSDAPVPDLVGVSEAAAILGVSRQRAWQLKDHSAFPSQLAELKSGPIWLRSSIEDFARTWERRPGRPVRKRP